MLAPTHTHTPHVVQDLQLVTGLVSGAAELLINLRVEALFNYRVLQMNFRPKPFSFLNKPSF